MSFIETIAPDAAGDKVAAMYRRLQGKAPYLPNYAGVFSHRPDILEPLSALQQGIASAMPPRLWALVSMAVAREINSSYCSLTYARRLLRRYFDETQLLAILLGGEDAPLAEAERAAMELAVKMARDSSAVNQVDIDRLRHCGYSDAQVFDIVAAAGYRCFFAKVTDALGAQPDAELAEIDSALLEQLLVGRAVAAGDDGISTTHQRGASC